jgi:hypothetical protein
MFHFPAFPPHTLCIQVRVTRHDSCRVTPFGHPGITARLTAPPGLSRPPTSFIGSWYQGIHHLPYTTSTKNYTQKTRCSRPLCTSQPTTNHHPHPTTPDTGNPAGMPQEMAINLTRKPKPTPGKPGQCLFFQDLTGCVISGMPPDAPTCPHQHHPPPHPTKQGSTTDNMLKDSSYASVSAI